MLAVFATTFTAACKQAKERKPCCQENSASHFASPIHVVNPYYHGMSKLAHDEK
ncbi:MAG: hypothetical protein ACLRV7_05230 [Hoylesella buccalis]|uniref:hypothetical protein n=1 Tax=Hoylesella buccalis TaxID=28127 RepID=UPI0015E0DC66|nr:hypothetical protein [Hoylesella buccalis]